MLTYFLRHPLRVVTRGMLLGKVWGSEPGMSTRTVDKHVESLRKKLPVFGAHVETVIGMGPSSAPDRACRRDSC
ncbi:MAG: helix-turn-helix domain-containing protein [Elusimicrobiota bacterium]